MSTSSWSQLRQQCRQSEAKTEELFHTYSQYSTAPNLPAQPTAAETATHTQIQECLSERETTIAALSRTLDSDPTPSALKSSYLSRHRELLHQHRQSLRQLESQLKEARNRANLLASVRSDIESYRAGGSTNPNQAEAEYMLDERARIDRSHGMTDQVLSQAYAVNESFGLQREALESIRKRMTGAASMVPGLNELMSRIGSKKRRDGYILGSFIAMCILMLYFFS